jgi:hypothetical protein
MLQELNPIYMEMVDKVLVEENVGQLHSFLRSRIVNALDQFVLEWQRITIIIVEHNYSVILNKNDCKLCLELVCSLLHQRMDPCFIADIYDLDKGDQEDPDDLTFNLSDASDLITESSAELSESDDFSDDTKSINVDEYFPPDENEDGAVELSSVSNDESQVNESSDIILRSLTQRFLSHLETQYNEAFNSNIFFDVDVVEILQQFILHHLSLSFRNDQNR